MADIKIVLVVDAENPIVGDLYLENGTCRLTSGLQEEVAQELYIRFRFFKGEWFLDRRLGLPYLQSILGKKTPLGIISQIFKNVLTTCPGVKSILSFAVKRLVNRGLAVDFAALLKDGAVLTAADFGAFIINQSLSVNTNGIPTPEGT